MRQGNNRTSGEEMRLVVDMAWGVGPACAVWCSTAQAWQAGPGPERDGFRGVRRVSDDLDGRLADQGMREGNRILRCGLLILAGDELAIDHNAKSPRLDMPEIQSGGLHDGLRKVRDEVGAIELLDFRVFHVAWEDDKHLLMVAGQDRLGAIVRSTLDGELERATDTERFSIRDRYYALADRIN